ncbi:MAG: hypothetical protein JXB47_21240 [Anaerolineae bacterium]|nr:hypothetical protein [Anaerolineae bacterium]
MLRRLSFAVSVAALMLLGAACSLMPSFEEMPAAPVSGRPAAPAAVDDDFRADPASVVAATGRPQLVEFFAFW